MAAFQWAQLAEAQGGHVNCLFTFLPREKNHVLSQVDFFSKFTYCMTSSTENKLIIHRSLKPLGLLSIFNSEGGG